MIRSTLVYFFNKEWQILLIKNKWWVSKWRWNWVWGKHEKWEDGFDCAIRETKEEVNIDVKRDDLVRLWSIYHIFEDEKMWTREAEIFVWSYDGEVEENDIQVPKWFDVEDIPYDQMWEDDKYWYHEMIKKKEISYKIYFDKNEKVVNIERK